MLLYGGVVVPALDAMALKLRATVPSFKKKKAALPAEVEKVQQEIWTETKNSLKAMQQAIASQVGVLEAGVAEKFSENSTLATLDNLPFINDQGSEEMAQIMAQMREKAVEFSREKLVCVERASQVCQLVSKQLKGVVDTRFK